MTNLYITLSPTAFNAWRIIEQFETEYIQHHQYGASSVFIGRMRDFNQSESVNQLFLEHYPGMTEKVLHDIASQHRDDYLAKQTDTKSLPEITILINHRIGEVNLGDDIVIVAVWSAHRKQAFNLCQDIMEDLKSKAPFWKKETLVNQEKVWVRPETC